MSDLVGVIPAAGRGTRAYPYTARVPKGMLEVDGKPLIERNIELMRDQLGIREVTIVIGHHGEAIESYFGDGDRVGVRLSYVRNTDLELGLAHSMRLAGRQVASTGRNAVAVLSDECYVGTNHSVVASFEPDGATAACAVLPTSLPQQIRRNYAVELDGDEIRDIVEKPTRLLNDLLGTGTYFLTPRLFELLEDALEAGKPVDWMDFLDGLIRRGETLRAIRLHGDYTNINTRDELNRANLLVRNAEFSKKRVSVVLPVERAGQPVADVVDRFAEHHAVDELLLVSRESEVAGETALGHANVRYVTCPTDASAGDLIRRGLDDANGDILVLAEAGDSFSPSDLDKLLTYVRDCDLVVGTRTTRQMIEQGSNMRGVVRLSHIFLAKVMELVWWRFDSRFSDVGCVYRALWSSTWRLIRPNVVTDGQEIYPEQVLEVLRARRRVIEIPVNYYNRDPDHEGVTSPDQTVGLFVRILWLIMTRAARRLGG